ncbi:invasion associated locus B family protein [Rhabdaerophilum sp.]|uniref:invasion associated locus B family protein n=1 Tax=Rhabdaerophilum sp. TaxID=2717341 RepID=UPI0038D3F35A
MIGRKIAVRQGSLAGKASRWVLAAGLVAACASAAVAQQRPPANAPAATAQQRANPNGTFELGTFGDWKAAISGQGRARVCYALASPNERLPKNLKRDPASIFVSTRIGDGAKNEVAIRLGFGAKPREDGTLTIGTANFALLTEGENAFLKNQAQEVQLLEAMRRGQNLLIKVTSARGNALTDRYSLKGFAQALERMAKECPG